MYTQVRQAIVNLLTSSALFQQVYEYEPAVLSSFPCITVSAQSSQSSDLATGTIMGPTQLTTYTFILRVYYGLTGTPGTITNDQRAQAESVILQKTDQLIDLLSSNRTLNGACQKSQPVSTTIGETQRELVVKYSETTLQVDVINQRV